MSNQFVYTKRERNGTTSTFLKIETGQRAIIIEDGKHYRLGGQVDNIVASHVITEAAEVYWCSVSQQWVESRSKVRSATAV